MRIDPHQPAVLVGVAVASAREAGADVAHDRTGVAADLFVVRQSLGSPHPAIPLPARGERGVARLLSAARSRSGVAGAFAMRTPVA